MSTYLIVIAVAAFGFAMFIAGTMIAIWSADEMYSHVHKNALDEMMQFRMKMQKIEADIQMIGQRVAVTSIDVTCINSDVKAIKDWAHMVELSMAENNKISVEDFDKATHYTAPHNMIEKPKRTYVWKRKPGPKPKVEVEPQVVTPEEK